MATESQTKPRNEVNAFHRSSVPLPLDHKVFTNKWTTRRLQKECKTWNDDDYPFFEIQPVNDKLDELVVLMHGPPATIYEGGLFYLTVKVTPEYPGKPPIIKFVTPVYHPNIDPDSGEICLDILSTHWCPALTINATLISVHSILDDPYPEDAINLEAAEDYMNCREVYDDIVRFQIKEHASHFWDNLENVWNFRYESPKPEKVAAMEQASVSVQVQMPVSVVPDEEKMSAHLLVPEPEPDKEPDDDWEVIYVEDDVRSIHSEEVEIFAPDKKDSMDRLAKQIEGL